ncbi:FHA domain-containing protein [Aliikangiella marina]|uniref:FHA domain-containing protein n=1 Tax=Aliikangiella marina TaxID=1712262 RepID=A0A545T6T4_9GAMM|nr:FHA domain-containing protein [Aliikangiella marina]TQV72882.1 FHA domain-containing protein [Aliikangiella marina]
MLKIQFKDRRKPALWLVDSTLKIGSDPSCDIVVDETGVDPTHVELDISQNEILLRNVSPQRSVFINEVPVVKEHILEAWDIIRLGTCELEIMDPLKERPENIPSHNDQATVIRPSVSPWMFKAMSPPLDGQYFSLASGFTIGREDKNDIVLPLGYISRQHAQVAIRKDKLYIEDMNSSNGTYVNDERVKSCELRNGDQVRLDEFLFSVVGPVTKVDSKPRTIVREKKAKKEKKSASKVATGRMQQELASQRVFFHGLSTDVQGKVFEITNVHTHLSRMLGHHLSRSEKSVSARHVYLNETDIGWEVKNDGASDGLLINEKMQSRAVLQDGDEIIVGGTRLKFQSVGDQPLSYGTAVQEKSSPTGLIIGVILVAAIAAGAAFFLGLI